MAPTHVPPFVPKRIELVEEVIFAFVKYETVWIIHPIPLRREVELRTERLIVSLCGARWRWRYQRDAAQREQNADRVDQMRIHVWARAFESKAFSSSFDQGGSHPGLEHVTAAAR